MSLCGPKVKTVPHNTVITGETLDGVLEWWSERLSFVLCWSVSWTRAGAIHACWPRVRKEREDKEETPLLLLTLFFFVLSCLSFSLCVSLFLPCLTHIASLHSSLTAALSVSYLLLLKPLALCLSPGLMLNWTRHYPSLSNTHKHTPSLLSSSTHSSLVLRPPPPCFFFLLPSAKPFHWGREKREREWKSAIQTLQALRAQTGRPIFPQQIPGMP